jgi:hypothetical protein
MSVDILTETMIERAVDDVASLQDGLELSATSALDPHTWQVLIAEERPRAVAGSGVDAVIHARRLCRRHAEDRFDQRDAGPAVARRSVPAGGACLGLVCQRDVVRRRLGSQRRFACPGDERVVALRLAPCE